MAETTYDNIYPTHQRCFTWKPNLTFVLSSTCKFLTWSEVLEVPTLQDLVAGRSAGFPSFRVKTAMYHTLNRQYTFWFS